MKWVSWCVSLLVVFLVYPSASYGQDAELPAQLEEYYGAYNFAVALSTPAERSALTRFSSAEAVRDSVGSERLAQVYRYMQEVSAHEMEVDPGIFTPRDAPRAEWYYSSDLIKTERVLKTDDARLIVEVTVYQVDKEDNQHFIREFEDGNLKAWREQLKSATLRIFTRYHEWRRTGSSWQKRAAYWQLLEENG